MMLPAAVTTDKNQLVSWMSYNIKCHFYKSRKIAVVQEDKPCQDVLFGENQLEFFPLT